MEPPDFRNATFEIIQAIGQERLRGEALDIVRRHGPATTRALAAAGGMDLLTLRPRVTELVQLGLVECLPVGAGGRNTEGIYRALSYREALAMFRARQRDALAETQLALF